MTAALDFADLDLVVQALANLDEVRSTGVDRADLTSLPGVWVRLVEVQATRLDGLDQGIELVIVAGEQHTRRALADLAKVYNAVIPLVVGGVSIQPIGACRFATMPLLDGTGVRYPALVVPIQLDTCPDPV